MNRLTFIGLIVGVFIILFFISLVVRKRKGTMPPKFDERQQWLRGRAYRTAFWVLIAYLCVNGLYSLLTETVWADAFTVSFIGVCLAVTVFVVICINRDAYFPLNQQSGLYMVLDGFIMLINLVAGIIRLLRESDSFYTDGMLNSNIMNFVIFVVFAAILAALLVRRLKDKSRSGWAEP